jgi:hypothetical protein
MPFWRGVGVSTSSARYAVPIVIITLLTSSAISTYFALRREHTNRLVADKAEIFLGSFPQGSPEKSATFRIMNDSYKKIYVDKYIASCGCTVAEVKPTVIDPGQVAICKIKFAPEESYGRLTNFVQLLHGFVDGKDKNTLTLKIVADVVPNFTVTPDRLSFGPSGGTKVVKITRREGATGIIQLPFSNDAAFTPSLDRTSENEWLISVHYDKSKWNYSEESYMEPKLTIPAIDEDNGKNYTYIVYINIDNNVNH